MGVRKFGSTSNVERFTIKRSDTGMPLTDLAYNTSGLIISTICDNEATATAYTQAAGNIETIATLGTYAAPTAGKCRFKEVDKTNHPGLYEFQFADARYAITAAQILVVSINGATADLGSDYEIPLVRYNPQDAVRLGLSALPNAAADNDSGLPIKSSLLSSFGIKKNTALPNFTFQMLDASSVPLTGLTVTGQVRKDSGSFGALTNSVTEVANGYYTVDLAAADVNADILTLRFTASGAAEFAVQIKTTS